MLRRSALYLLAFALMATPAAAQTRPQHGEATGEERRPPDAPVTGEAWYSAQLQELAEVLGGAHYLRITCEGRRDQRWREYMRRVIDREPEHNGEMVEAFNRGYRNEESRFAECDETTRQVEAELRARGLRVARGLSARHAE